MFCVMDVNEVSQTGLRITFVWCRLRARKCVYAMERLDHDKVMESYAEEMGLTVLEWIEAYDHEYKTRVWI